MIGLSAYPVENGSDSARRGVAARPAGGHRRRARRRASALRSSTSCASSSASRARSCSWPPRRPRSREPRGSPTRSPATRCCRGRFGAAEPADADLPGGDRAERRPRLRAAPDLAARRPASVFLASVYSFGVLFAFTAAQVAVIRLRATEPDLERPFRAPLDVRIRGVGVPLPALIGAPLTFAVWIASLMTHEGALVAGPIWVALGLRRLRAHPHLPARAACSAGRPRRGRPRPRARGRLRHDPRAAEAWSDRRGGARDGASSSPRSTTPASARCTCRSAALRADGRRRWRTRRSGRPPRSSTRRCSPAEHGVAVEGRIVRARAIGEAIVDQARDSTADLIVLGSSPRWRRQSRFFSPTVDYVLRHADCRGDGRRLPRGRPRSRLRGARSALRLTE